MQSAVFTALSAVSNQVIPPTVQASVLTRRWLLPVQPQTKAATTSCRPSRHLLQRGGRPLFCARCTIVRTLQRISGRCMALPATRPPPTTGPRNKADLHSLSCRFHNMAYIMAYSMLRGIAILHQAHLLVLYSRGVISNMCYIAGWSYHTFK